MNQRKHNKLIEEFNEYSKKKPKIKEVKAIIEKYNIDINYDDSLLLVIACAVGPNFKLCRILLDMGCDPYLIADHKSLVYDTHITDQIRLDGLFRSYDFELKWQGTLDYTPFLDFYAIERPPQVTVIPDEFIDQPKKKIKTPKKKVPVLSI